VLIILNFSIEPLMDNIIEPSDEFDFSNLSLANPTGIQGGAYFTKIENNNKALYIQTPKSLTKQGFVKNGKKIVVDLMFNNNDEKFINWVENLETKCQELICEKGDSWFQNKLEINDIETAFASPLRVYKSGRYYLMRVNVKMNYATNAPSVKIYDESELPLSISDINENTNIISILEIQGIKFTSRNFQIEIELKQSMVLNTEILFDNCLIKTSIKKSKEIKHDPLVFKMMENSENNFLEENANNQNSDSNLVSTEESNFESESLEEINSKSVLELESENATNNVHFDTNDSIESNVINESNSELKEVELHIEDLEIGNEEVNDNDLKEFDLNSNLTSLETITLKKPNQVYHEIYRAAREKAKKAKKEAIQAFLEAKNIKKTYMLDEIEDSDDSDMEFESIEN
jgi:hypothetical protein